MADSLYWDDAYPIALTLNAVHRDVVDPSIVTLLMLKEWIVSLEAFADDRDASTIEWLEQIQVEWVELKQ